MPLRGENRVRGTLVSVLLHGLLVLGLMFPVMMAEHTFAEELEGGGGPGPRGGGGGGSGGTGGRALQDQERIQFIRLAPEPTVVPVAPEVIPPPVPPVVPPPEPVVPPPTPPPVPVIPPPEPVVEVKPADPPAVTAPPVASVIPGVGGGSGNDGTRGNGPGSGGGVGSGTGTGRGSGIGPGTGGGPGTVYLGVPILLGWLPPAPRGIAPYHIVVLFDVDSTGKVLSFKFNETKDRDYNRRLKAFLAEVRFRPATTFEGRAIRATHKVEYDIY
jgi:protein TonB